MLKHHKLISFCLALLFLIVLQKFATPVPIFRFLVPAFLAFAAIATAYNYWYLKQIEKYNFWILIRPLLLLIASFGVFLVMPATFLSGLFLIIDVVIITIVEILLGNTAENILLNETLLIAFGLFVALFGAYWYAASFEPFYLMAIFAGSSLLARSFYEAVPQPAEVKLAGSIIIGLLCSELYWVLNFLQLHYSALALILFNLFYFCLVTNYYYLFHNLNFKKIQFQLLFMLACLVLIVATTPWSIAQ